jgi:hypothetical protein
MFDGNAVSRLKESSWVVLVGGSTIAWQSAQNAASDGVLIPIRPEVVPQDLRIGDTFVQLGRGDECGLMRTLAKAALGRAREFSNS